MPEAKSPVGSSERHVILDVLRGIALLGICLANFQEFSLWSFQSAGVREAMPTAGADSIARFFIYLFVDGKFYTLFSILFGIGFSIMISKGTKIFYRRTVVLFFIGLFHLLFLWAGDILILYALVGLLLPLFRKVSNRKLIVFSAVLLLSPIVLDACVASFGWNLSAPVVRATACFHDRFGITDTNFPVWLAEKQTYADVLRFNLAGSFIRMQEFIDGNRVFKVLGLFLLGLWIGRNKIYADLAGNRRLLQGTALWGTLVGLPTSILYAWEATGGHPFGLAGHSAIYAVSVVPMSLAYTAAICLLYLKGRERKIFAILAAPGRMALTNYIMQSALGMAVFYGIGWGFGATTGLVRAELAAAGVFIFQVAYSYFWLRRFQYGPLEWGWRMATYGKRLKLKKSA